MGDMKHRVAAVYTTDDARVRVFYNMKQMFYTQHRYSMFLPRSIHVSDAHQLSMTLETCNLTQAVTQMT